MPIKYTGSGQPVVPDKPQQAPKYTDQNRPLGSRSVLGGRRVVWAGPDWRWQSPASYQRLQSTGKLNRSPFSNPLGAIKNELKYFGKQISQTNSRGRQSVAQDAVRGVIGAVVAPAPFAPLRNLRLLGQTGRNLEAALTVGVAENASKLVIAAGQKLRGKPANPESSRAGNFVEKLSQAGYRALGATPPGQQNEFERGLDATARSVGTSVAATAVASKAIPAIGTGIAGAVITGGARWAAGELLASFADDNRAGNLANLGEAFGMKLPLSVNVGEDDWLDSAIKSLIPNALPGVAISGVGEVAAGLTRSPGIISSLRNSKRWTASNRKVAEITDARARLEQAGVTVTDPDTGAIALRTSEIEAEAAAQAEIDRWIGGGGERPPAAPALPGAEPTATPALPAAADAPSAQISLELDAQPPKAAEPDAPAGGQLEVEGIEDSPFEMIYDPELPEADVVFNLVRELDDDQLQMLVRQPGPVVEQLDQMLQQRQAMPVRPELAQGAVMAPGENIAERLGPDGQPIPYEATLEAMPMDTLRSVAAPDNNPELAQLIGDLTGRDWEEFTKADIIEGLAAYQQQTGQSLLVRDWNQGMRPTAEIAADPERFQFKQGVNERGEQLGNSLAGVERWDTNAEGALDVWTDPADGRTYVVNGHNRLARAQQLGVPTVPVRELPAATAQEARAFGALSNIQAGQGTVFDAAKFMRDSGITSPDQLQQLGVPMSSGNAARGLALAQLPDNIFQAAVDGRLSVGKAAALGGSGLDETQMQTAFKALGGQDMSDAKFAEMVAQVRSAPVVQGSQVDLFGNTEAMSLMSQKADLVVKIRQDLLKDKRFFGTAAKGAGRLEQAGNKINVAGNKAIAADTTQVLAMFDQLKYTTGPVSDLLNDGARQIAEGAKPGVIADRIRGDIAEAVRRSLDEQGMPTQRPAGAARADGGFDLEAERADSARATQEADALFAEAEGLLAGMQENTSRMAEGARRMLEVSAGIEDIDGALPTDRIVPGPRALSPEERAALQIQAVQKAADQAEIRPPETPIPELPDGPAVRPDVARADLEARGQLEPGSPSAQAAADELRLGLEFAEQDAQMQAIALEGARDAMDYELLTFEQKKAMGMADGYDADTSSTPAGWKSIDVGAGRNNTPQEMRELQRYAEALVRKVAGDEVGIRFNETYQQQIRPKQWGGDGKQVSLVGGRYTFEDDLITINNMLQRDTYDLTDVAYHEAFHRIQYLALSEKEAKVLDTAFARLKIATGSGHIMVDKGTPSYSESMAVAFARYATAKALGDDPIQALLGASVAPDDKLTKAFVKVAAGFDSLLDFVEKMYNLVKNGAFDSTRAVFERARRGDLRDKEVLGGYDRMADPEPPGWRVSTAAGAELGGGMAGPDLLPAPVRPEPMRLVDVPPASTDTRGKGEFYHGAANEFELTPGGEFDGDGMNIYGNGFYATDDLTTASRYQKKNRKGAPADAAPTVYRVVENQPVKFYDLDKPASKATLNTLRKSTSRRGLGLLDQAIEEAGEKASLAEIMDEMRGWSREFDLPAYEVQEIFQGFIDALEKDGYGGFTHVGGNLAGNGNRNHQVRIYWDPVERITIEKVEPSMAEPRTKAADQAARKQIETNNQRMDEIRRQAQQEGC